MLSQNEDTSNLTISIAICTFNGANYLQEQLVSIAKQTYLPDELVVCDNASADSTLQILDEFKKKVLFPEIIHCNLKRKKIILSEAEVLKI